MFVYCVSVVYCQNCLNYLNLFSSYSVLFMLFDNMHEL